MERHFGTSLLGALLLATSVGCAAEPVTAETTSTVTATSTTCSSAAYTLRMDPEIASLFSSEVSAVASTWQAQLGGKVTFAVDVGAAAKTEADPCKIDLVWQNDGNTEVWGELASTSGEAAVLYLSADLRPARREIVHATLLHELRHALGLGHDVSHTDKTAMWPFLTVPGRLGCEDVRRACALWSCTPTCVGNAWAD